MQQAGYLELLRENADFRRLWLGDVTSLLGDWLNLVAVYTLIDRLTGSPLALALVFLTKSLPFALASPLAGVIADRFNRRRLMIGADLLRALIVLGLLLVRTASDVPLLYLLGAAQMVIGAAFIPARSASIPNVTTPRQLLTANALQSASWSALLALGAAVGGIATDRLGVRAVFVLDCLTYLVSAACIFRTPIPQEPAEQATGGLVRTAWVEVVAGWRHLRTHPRIGRMVLAKPAWALGGSGLVYMLALLGQGLVAGRPSLGLGWLYTARGLGTGLGPILARAWFPRRRTWPVLIGCCIAFSGVAYFMVGWGRWALAMLLVLVALAHTSSGASWVASTVLLQVRTEDRFRGRVFSTEWLLLTLTNVVAILSASLLLETKRLRLDQTMMVFAGLQMLTGVAWLLLVTGREARAAEE